MIRVRIPEIASLINKNIDELEAELDQLGRPVAIDAAVRNILIYLSLRIEISMKFLLGYLSNCFCFYQAQLYTILELCRAFDRVFKEHLDGG